MSSIASASTPQSPAPAYPANEPPVYTLSVDPTPTAPSPESPETPTQPPAYSGNARPQYPYDLSLGSPSDVELMSESLPTYKEECTMEPETLWKYGFICPLLWLIGMTIKWIPLAPVEEEADAEKAQRLEEMMVILRPQTKTLWTYGFICPLLWLIGMAIIWIPLAPVEEEADAEKAQRLEEMLVILRRTEL
ncbi:hypothetical protein B9479_008289, partial [Cryptococcus floricola]